MKTVEEIKVILDGHGYRFYAAYTVWLGVPFAPSALVTENKYVHLSHRPFLLKTRQAWDRGYTKRQLNAIERANNRELKRYSHLDPEYNEVMRHCS